MRARPLLKRQQRPGSFFGPKAQKARAARKSSWVEEEDETSPKKGSNGATYAPSQPDKGLERSGGDAGPEATRKPTKSEDPEVASTEPALTVEDIPRLRAQWMEKIADLLEPPPLQLPPLREINHRIKLVDKTKTLRHRVAKCPDALRPQFEAKLKRYMESGWWEPANVSQASPMLCLAKKNGTLRTVVDCRERNDNTEKDATPLPDQDMIRNDLARFKYRSKIDLSDAYEQVRVEPEDVPNTAFLTYMGTYLSNVMQQGDCNAPSTFHRVICHIFRDRLNRGVYPFMDDVHNGSMTIEEHEVLLGYVFDKLRRHKLHLNPKKVELYAESLEVLGHRVDDEGIHADSDKMETVRKWPRPVDYHGVQRFLGMVNYVSQYLPEVSAYTSPLHAMGKQKFFQWLPLHEKSFEMIKALTCKAPVLKPIDYDRAVKEDEKIFLITDASVSGVGAYYGQGKEWRTCRPAGFMSKKFSSAQSSYFTWEQEILAVLEGLSKWEDKLIGRPITLVTDHKSLQFFTTQNRMSNRQVRWWEYISRFNFEVMYVPGEQNKVADALSRMYHNLPAPEGARADDWVSIDRRLDPEGEDLPHDVIAQARAMQLRPRDRTEIRIEESRELNKLSTNKDDEERPSSDDENDVAWNSGSPSEPLEVTVEGQSLLDIMVPLYREDRLFSKILENPEHHDTFSIKKGIVYARNPAGKAVICVPGVLFKGRRVTEIAIDQAHRVLGHKSSRKTLDYIRRWYWWPNMVKDITTFCESCGMCQTTKSSTQKPEGLLHSLPIPSRPWESIGMDFIGPFPKSHGMDYLLLVICRLTSMVHLIPTKTTAKATDIAWLFVKEIVRLHGLPESIVSDRDRKFVSKFWKETHRMMGVKLLMSTAFHPQTDGASERAVRNVSQVLRTAVADNQKDWTRACPMTEFAINSSVSATTQFALFELNYGWMPVVHVTGVPSAHAGVREYVDQAVTNLMAAHDAILTHRVAQTEQANKRRRPESLIAVGDLVYLATADLNLPKGRARKLMPKFIGPYPVVEAQREKSTYKLALPPELVNRRIHPRFHVSRLRKHVENDDDKFPKREVKTFYDFGDDPATEWLVDEIVDHDWKGKTLWLRVKWDQGDLTWEKVKDCEDLEALDNYLELCGVKEPAELSRGRARSGENEAPVEGQEKTGRPRGRRDRTHGSKG
jgi:hypothetical protein